MGPQWVHAPIRPAKARAHRIVVFLLILLVSSVVTPAQAQNVDPYEPNDSFDTPSLAFSAPPPSCAAPQTLTNALISPADEVDFYRITASTPRIVTITVSAQIPATATNDLSLLVQATYSNGESWFTRTTSPGGLVGMSFYNVYPNVSYLIRVQANSDSGSADLDAKPYQIQVCQSDSAVTPPAIPTGTPTATLGPAGLDVFEVNNTPADVLANTPVRSFLNVGSTFDASQRPNFYSASEPFRNVVNAIRELGDVDWYFFSGRAGSRYRITSVVDPGVDTEMFIYGDSAALRAPGYSNADRAGLIGENDDYQALDRGSQIIFDAGYDGLHWIKVWNKDPAPRSGSPSSQRYNISVVELGGTPTPTSTPRPTLTPTQTLGPAGQDVFEVNNTPADVLSNTPVRSFINVGSTFETSQRPNFYSASEPFRNGINAIRDFGDVDWYFFAGRSGSRYRITTLVDPGVDTEIFIYGDSTALRTPGFSNTDRAGLIIENDDFRPFDRGSQVIFNARYDGLHWIKVWNKDPVPRSGSPTSQRYNLALVEISQGARFTWLPGVLRDLE
jgi:hypothetical protein